MKSYKSAGFNSSLFVSFSQVTSLGSAPMGAAVEAVARLIAEVAVVAEAVDVVVVAATVAPLVNKPC
jgi:hypothetical protein